VALSQYELLCDVATAARGALRADLWSIAAGYAALLGWLYQDAGDLTASGRWHDVMIERAHRSQGIQLVAFALHCKAMLHADMGDGPGSWTWPMRACGSSRTCVPRPGSCSSSRPPTAPLSSAGMAPTVRAPGSSTKRLAS